MAFTKANQDFDKIKPFSRRSADLKEMVVIVDPEKTISPSLVKILQANGIGARVFSEVESALKTISFQWNGILVAHFGSPVVGGLELLVNVKRIDPGLPVLVTLDHEDTPLMVSAMRMGAYDVIQRPHPTKDILKIILGALENRRWILENRALQLKTGTKRPLETFVAGRSNVMERLCETLWKVGEVDAEVLLVGESGTGKKLVARCLHDQSPKRHKKFVAVNCCAISEETLEIDLFGHNSGSFARVQHPRIGKLEHAQGGTIYLDKIDCLSLRLQDRLLNVLQERKLARFGSNDPTPIDIRVIASTKRDLNKAREEGSFREDLFYRLNVIWIALPALRDHREDIPLLFQHFALQACAAYNRPTPLITSETFRELLEQDWLGNVRELKNAAERFALGFGLDLTGPCNREESVRPNEQMNGQKRTLVEKMSAFEKNLIAQELIRTKGNIKETCLTLGLPRKTFYDKLTKHGLKRKDFLKPRKPSNNRSALH